MTQLYGMTPELAKQLLLETDYVVLGDVHLTAESKEEFINYRFYMRRVVQGGDYVHGEVPLKPEVVWDYSKDPM
tara:strand:+ start:812 stop:1033 length:222 start_codon:yes stop_codon:yes gene_type:complete